MKYQRILQLPELVEKKSHFLFGARSTGKTYLIREQLANEAYVVNLLKGDVYSRLASRPALLEGMIADSGKTLVVIDEVQRLPNILNEVHRLIEEKRLTFLLTGSSARKLVKGGANLLAGRARKAKLFPLTYAEIPEFQLGRYLTYGGLPAVYPSSEPYEDLQAYVQTYLTEEIAAEGLVRDLPRFSRFVRDASRTNAEILNYSKIASDLGVSPTTIREYYRILEDTLVGYLVEPIRKKSSRKEVSTAKFYLFDPGVANALRGVRNIEEESLDFGRAFEHFIALELIAALSYQRTHLPLRYWRTHTQREVDFVVEDKLAVEVKAATSVSLRDIGDLKAFAEDYAVQHKIVVSRDPLDRVEQGVQFLNYTSFLTRLWAGDYF